MDRLQEISPEGCPPPHELLRLLEAGLWPVCDQETQQYEDRRISSADVQKLISVETVIHLYSPPWKTVAQVQELGPSERNDQGSFQAVIRSLGEIDPEKALFIADFGAASEAKITLDYRGDCEDPPVLAMEWADQQEVPEVRWICIAESFSTFARELRLWDLPPFRNF